jgi:ABC-type multidrug transport system ATPase subunit
MAGRTTFVIAHRLSTIELADQIVVLDHGRIVAEGDHERLLETSELYREIVAGTSSAAGAISADGTPLLIEHLLATGTGGERDAGATP